MEQRTMKDLWNAHAKWSNETFGDEYERGPIGPLKHLIKEANEAIQDIHNPFEYVDCLLLVLDAARRSGLTYERLLNHAFMKLEINMARKFPPGNHDEPVEHL